MRPPDGSGTTSDSPRRSRPERRLGPSAAGWVAALPIALSVAIVAVALDAGTGSATALALSAATHVPAQIAFGVAFASVLVRRGLVLGAATGALAYLACAALIPHAPDVLAVTLAVVVLAVVQFAVAALFLRRCTEEAR